MASLSPKKTIIIIILVVVVIQLPIFLSLARTPVIILVSQSSLYQGERVCESICMATSSSVTKYIFRETLKQIFRPSPPANNNIK